MQPVDINSLFARAEQHFVAGRLDAARTDLENVQKLAGDHPAILHLTALVEKNRGNAPAARAAFERAGPLAPDDPRLAANHANLLGEIGEADRALALYAQAIRTDPRFAEARYNRALLLQKLGRLDEALADLDHLVAGGKADAKVHSARGSLLRAMDRFDEAADAYDQAIARDPTRLTALHGRARVAMERGEPGASDLYQRALAQRPGDLELVLGLTEAFEAEGNPLGLEVLREVVARNPDWVLGHEILARMRSEAGEGDEFAGHYVQSLAARPSDQALHYSYWQSLVRGEKHKEALEALRAARGQLGEGPDLRLMEAVFMSESGDPAAGLDLLEGLDSDDPGVRFARGRMALRRGDGELASDMFGRLVEADPDSIRSWAHLSIAWRLTGDDRHSWLCEQPGLYAPLELGLSAGELERLADCLRSLHRTRAHPIGQSLRGGTQTRGRLFGRSEPEIIQVREAIMTRVHEHFALLPPRDDTHPLLRHRDSQVTTTGSWSVRLTSQGFHVNHIHPEGVLSSACYISLPASLGSVETKDGWLELGRPPVELGLALEPIASIEPAPGRLALFPSYLFHGTRPFSDGERLTIAFDVAAR